MVRGPCVAEWVEVAARTEDGFIALPDLRVTGPQSGEDGVISLSVEIDGKVCGFAPLDSAAAGELADLVSLKVDLEMVRERCQVLRDNPELPELPRDAVLEAALIAYRRGWNKGKGAVRDRQDRTKMPDQVLECLTAEEHAVHEQALQAGHQHVAHRIDPAGEVVRVCAVVSTDTDPAQLVGVVPLVARRVGTDLAGRMLPGLDKQVAVLEAHTRRRLGEVTAALVETGDWRPRP